jgi:hypothetical protein
MPIAPSSPHAPSVARSGARPHPSWSSLGGRARLWRLVHAIWSAAQLGCLAYLWAAVIRRRRGPRVWAAAGFLVVEGGALVVGAGNCPMGMIQERWGDPVPFFELLLPPRAAKAAIPVLAAVSLAAIAGLALRPPGLRLRA